MTSDATTPEAYLAELPDDRKTAVSRLRLTLLEHLPDGFEETMNYGMLGYVVPHRIYPDGYHCDPKQPLPFINVASQKNHIGFYHLGIYSDSKLLDWFVGEYPKHVNTKLDMGKSCIRFKNPEKIPYELIGELATKMDVEDWIRAYEKGRKQAQKRK